MNDKETILWLLDMLKQFEFPRWNGGAFECAGCGQTRTQGHSSECQIGKAMRMMGTETE